MPDPTNPQHLNRYTYVLNNPLRYTDPTGHKHVAGERFADGGWGGGGGSSVRCCSPAGVTAAGTTAAYVVTAVTGEQNNNREERVGGTEDVGDDDEVVMFGTPRDKNAPGTRPGKDGKVSGSTLPPETAVEE